MSLQCVTKPFVYSRDTPDPREIATYSSETPSLTTDCAGSIQRTWKQAFVAEGVTAGGCATEKNGAKNSTALLCSALLFSFLGSFIPVTKSQFLARRRSSLDRLVTTSLVCNDMIAKSVQVL